MVGAWLTCCASPQICNMMKTMMKSPPTCGRKPAGLLLGDLLKLGVLKPSTRVLSVVQVTSGLLPGTRLGAAGLVVLNCVAARSEQEGFWQKQRVAVRD